jgi:hypothetical protein
LISSAVPVSTRRRRPLEVDVHRRALVDLAAGQVADHVDVRVLHRGEHALGRDRRERGVDRRDHPVEPGERLVRTSSVPFARMFTSTPCSSRNGFSFAFSAASSFACAASALAQVVRVVGDREVGVAARLRGERHLLHRRLAVRGPRRVRVQVAAQVALLDEHRKLAAPRRLELAAFSRSSGGMYW